MDAFTLSKVAEIQLVYKHNCKASQRPQITCSKDAYHILAQSWDENKIDFVEQAKVVLLSRANKVLGICEISTGGVSGTVVDPKLVFAAALKANASALILAHNHPSRNMKPSEQDKKLTSKMEEAGNFLEINVMDHLIMTGEGYYSFKDDTEYKIDRNPSYTPF